MKGDSPIRDAHRRASLQRLNRCARFLYALLLAAAAPATAYAQDNPARVTVSGRVTNETTGEPVPGVTVYHEPSRTGTVTNAAGSYTISVPRNATLQFSSIGFAARNVQVPAASGVINVVLAQSAVNLEELVVTGMASTIKRRNLANAVATVSAKDIIGTTRQETVDAALNGKIAGVNIRSITGAPGGGVNMQFRGVSTLGAGSSQPLYIIDGVRVDNSSIGSGRTAMLVGGGTGTATRNDNVANRMADINPEDIESIEVLKGPSAAAIYGARANAGVVIITTKRGAPGRTSISMSQDLGFASALRYLGFDDWSEQKIDLIFTDPARNALEKQRFREGQRYDFEDLIYGEKGLLSNTQVNVSGGSEQTRFFVGAGLQEEEGIILHTGFGRRTIRANVDHQFNERVKLASSSNYINYESDRGFTDNGSGASIGYNLANTPNYWNLQPDAEGNYPANPYFRENPFAVRDLGLNHTDVNRFIQGFTFDADLIRQENGFLKLLAQGGIDFLTNQSIVYFPETLQNQRNQPRPGDVIHGKQSNLNTNWQAFISYNTTRGAINSNTQLGLTGARTDVSNLYVRGQGLAPGQKNMTQAQSQQIFTHFDQAVQDVGVAGQQELNWADRVIGTVGLRLDKSSLNANENQFYTFPKASLAVNLPNFDFWQWDALDQFKLRAAYGETGGLPQYGQTFEVLSGTNIGGSLGSVILNNRGVDPNLRPERAAELEFGADIGIAEGRFGVELTYYRKKVRDLILDLIPAASTGINAIATNAADLQNNGLELAVRAVPFRASSLNWATQLTFWNNRTKITRLDVPSFSTGGFGASLGDYIVKEGVSPTMVVGTPLVNGELTQYGDAQPDWNLSFHNAFTLFRNVELSGLMHYQHGGTISNLSQFLMDGGGTTPDWSDDDDGDGIPNGRDRGDPTAGRYIEDATFFKIREIGLYYSVPTALAGRFFGSRRMRVGFSGKNLLLVSDYRSYDPEVSVNGVQAVANTVEIAAYPSSRRFVFSVNVDF